MRILTRLNRRLCRVPCRATRGGAGRRDHRPAPEIRALVDAFTGAVLGNSPETWEAMTREQCAPEFLTKNPAAQRRKLYDTLHGALPAASAVASCAEVLTSRSNCR